MPLYFVWLSVYPEECVYDPCTAGYKGGTVCDEYDQWPLFSIDSAGTGFSGNGGSLSFARYCECAVSGIVLVPFIREHFKGNGNSILTASILLGIMILPTIIGVSESAIRAVENSYYEGALALGATHERSVFTVIVPAAKSGIMAAVVLGVGRAIGETMAVMMVAGNQARVPSSIFKGVRTLTANIVMEMGYATDLHREALIATGVVLFVFILIINVSFSILKRRTKDN